MGKSSTSKKIVAIITASPITINAFLLPHIRALSKDYIVYLLANFDKVKIDICFSDNIIYINIPIARKISIFNDIYCLLYLCLFFCNKDINLVQTISPKAGLIGILASFIMGVKIRIHYFTGQVWSNEKFLYKYILKTCDRIIYRLSTDILVDSHGQLSFLVQKRVVKYTKASVLGHGSICGVDTSIFCRNKYNRSFKRLEMNTSEQAFVCLYLGRINRDKGVIDLVKAFINARAYIDNLELWIIGPSEDNIYLSDIISYTSRFGNTNITIRNEFCKDPYIYMQAADLFVLPSYREGFGQSVIEAAACGLPAIVTDIYGLQDVVDEGISGFKYRAGDLSQLSSLIRRLASSESLHQSLSAASFSRAHTMYSQEHVVTNHYSFYSALLE